MEEFNCQYEKATGHKASVISFILCAAAIISLALFKLYKPQIILGAAIAVFGIAGFITAIISLIKEKANKVLVIVCLFITSILSLISVIYLADYILTVAISSTLAK